MNQITEALRAARACIQQDRTSLADTGMRPDNTIEPDAAAGVAEYDAVLQQIDAALASLSTREAQAGWQPIDTAPRDGVCQDGHNHYSEYVLVWWPNAAYPLRARWWYRDDTGACNFITDGRWACFPTVWQHLPPAPIKKEQEA